MQTILLTSLDERLEKHIPARLAEWAAFAAQQGWACKSLSWRRDLPCTVIHPLAILPRDWRAVELFRPGLLPWGARALYLDLSQNPADLSPMVRDYQGRFGCAFRQGRPDPRLMVWRVGAVPGIYTRFAANPRAALKTPNGFTGWIMDHVPHADDLCRLGGWKGEVACHRC